MTSTKEYFIYLISSYINEKQPDEPSAEVDWNEILRLASIHSVQVMTYLAVDKLSQKPHIYNELKNLFMASVNISTRQEHEMKKVIKALNENQIAHTLFKGYLLRDLYPDKEARTFGDIDFLVNNEDREKCHRLLLDIGYTFDKEHYNKEVWTYRKGVVSLEVHTSLSYQEMPIDFDYNCYFKNVSEKAVLYKDYTYQLTDEDHFIYIVTHLAKHFYHMGVGIRMIADVALYIKNLGIGLDWKYIFDEIEKIKLKKFLMQILAICRQIFDISTTVGENEVCEEPIIEYIINHGVFGFDDKNVYDVGFHKGKNKTTYLNRFFISYEEMKDHFKWFEKCPVWMLPYGWLRRFFSHIFDNKKRRVLCTRISSLSHEGDDSVMHKIIMKKIGLD